MGSDGNGNAYFGVRATLDFRHIVLVDTVQSALVEYIRSYEVWTNASIKATKDLAHMG